MKLSAAAFKQAEPYETLEAILKIANRSWLSEEWRLEDIRLLAQDAVSRRNDNATAANHQAVRKESRPAA